MTTRYTLKMLFTIKRIAGMIERGETERALRLLGFLALRIERGVFVGHAKGYKVKGERGL